MNRLVKSRAWVVMAATTLLVGCANMKSHDELTGQVQAAQRAGGLEAALQTLEASASDEAQRTALLYNLERGELLRLNKRYEDSTHAFMIADNKVKEWEEAAKTNPDKLLGTVGAATISERLKVYEGQDYEKVWLTTRLALNRVASGDLDTARVDIKRTHEREAVIAEFRAKETAAALAAKKPIFDALAATPIEKLPENPELMQQAIAGGRAAFRVNCVQCHGSGAAGSVGYPNLNDDDWLWGGDIATIHTTLVNGVRQPNNDLTRMSIMPAFGRDAILQPGEISDVADYVRTVSHQQPVTGASQRGAVVFAANCAVCHGPDGKGMRAMGAPNLTDAIWLYGSSRQAIVGSITNAHAGVMPAWGTKLSPVTIKMLAAYVHSLGGGEDFAAGAGQAEAAAAAVAATPAGAGNVQP